MEPNPHLHKPAQMLLEKGRQPKRVSDEQWLKEYWENENKNDIDPGFYREGPPGPKDPGFYRGLPSPDPKGRYKSYVESFENPAVMRGRGIKGPLSYKDWLRWTRWRYEERGPHSVLYEQDDPEWWRTNKNNRQRAK